MKRVEESERTQGGNGDGSGEEAGTGTEAGVKTRGRTQNGNVDGCGDGTESSSGDGDKNGDGNGAVIGDGKADENGERRGEEESSGLRRTVDQAFPFRMTRDHLRRQEVTPYGSQKRRVEDLVSARRCVTEGRTGH